MLMMIVFFHFYIEPKEMVEISQDLLVCQEKLFSALKEKEEVTEDDENSKTSKAPKPLLVLIDILLSFLAKPVSWSRNTINRVFKVYMDDFDFSCLKLLADVLVTNKNTGPALEVVSDEEDEGDDEEDENKDKLFFIDDRKRKRNGSDEESEEGSGSDKESDDSDEDESEEDSEDEKAKKTKKGKKDKKKEKNNKKDKNSKKK